MPKHHDLLSMLRDISRRPQDNLSLAALADRSGWSRFHLHRTFRHLFAETPKQYTLRLQLDRAAAALISTGRSVLDIAIASGFANHEVFTRAFRRRFGRTPSTYRARALRDMPELVRDRHAQLTSAVSPCMTLFHLPTEEPKRNDIMPTLKIERQMREEQPALCIRRRISRTDIAAMLGECYGLIFVHGHKVGAAFVGRPFARYLDVGPGLWTIEAGFPIASAVSGEGEIEATTLPGGSVAVGIHAGKYEELPETNAAIERWIDANGFRAAGPPWESYITDPAELPDPAGWRTEVYWPLAD